MTIPGGGRARTRPENPGDVGRRVQRRREQLGLTRAQTAALAGMAVNYLEYVETSPAPIELDGLTSLADALNTSVGYLLGGGLDLPPGQGAPAAHPVVKSLEAWECWSRISPRGVGRVALSTPDGPQVLPVNYRVLDGTVLYRTTEESTLAGAAGSQVAFEVDQLDEALREGWSVLVAGRAERVTDPEVLEWFHAHADPRPWAGGQREVWLRIRPTRITGRIIRTGAASDGSA